MAKASVNRNQRLHFGTYHHTTPRNSEKTRQNVKVLFKEAFSDLPFSRDDELRILDIGCGLGFLSCFCAEHYPNAKITGFDRFEHVSLKNSSLAKAKNNAKVLGFSERIRFQKIDFFESDFSKEKFDLFVSNLVFHNFGKARLEAYDRLARWATPVAHIVLGDMFFDYKADSKRLTNLFGGVQERPGPMIHKAYKIVVLSKPKKSIKD
jgi:2-polyprenyl-3-methyl-5-hydroxy-6-metoxy-1,4-benzoquinol methylase